MAPEAAKVPAKHFEHDPEFKIEPEEQEVITAVQEEAPASEVYPVGQEVQELAPESE